MKILITAPSLNENENVSGISSVARQIIERGRFSYVHFEAGRRDGEKAGARWIAKQIRSVAHFRRTLKDERVDVAHINTTLTPLAVWRDAVYARAARSARVPVVLHVHGGRFLTEEFKSRLLARAAEKMLRSARVVIVLSELEKRIVERRWPDLNVQVLENAVAVDRIEYAAGRLRTEKTIIFLGRLHESKGLGEIVGACRALKKENFEFRFRAFGAGEQTKPFVRGMRKILGEKFFYGGVVKGADKMRELAGADIFLLPSRYGEGLPMALLEAMAAGAVAVISEMASVGAVVRDGENGFLIEPGNVAQLVEKLKFLLDAQVDWETVRRNARQTVEEKFDLKEYIEKLESIYRETLGKS